MDPIASPPSLGASAETTVKGTPLLPPRPTTSQAESVAPSAASVPPPAAHGGTRRTSPLAKILTIATPLSAGSGTGSAPASPSTQAVIDPSLLSPASQAASPISPSAAAAAYPTFKPIPIPSAQISGLAKHPLTLQTALDNRRLSLSAFPSTISSGTTGRQSLPLSLASSPLTTPSDSQSGFDSVLSSPGVATSEGSLYDGEADDGEGDEADVPKPKHKVKKSHARKQPEGHIKRARNAFILFRKHITDSNLIPPTVEVKHQNISVVAAKMWREAPHDVRAKFQEMARIEKEEHNRKYPNYRYQPVFRRTDIIRRRVRKDGPEDEKVDAVADALIHGKAGKELEKEITEQDLVDPAADISPENSAARSRSRRRRDPGVPSKGAIRAQKTQQRQKQMRTNLLGHNLLNISLYNAAQQQAQQAQRAAAAAAAEEHARAHAHGYYAGRSGYDSDPYAHAYDPYAHRYPPAPAPAHPHNYVTGPGAYAQEYPEEMYRLPPLMGYHDPAYGSTSGPEAYYPPPPPHAGHGYEPGRDFNYHHHHPYDPAYGQGVSGNGGYELDRQYQLPPLLNHTPDLPPLHPGPDRPDEAADISHPSAKLPDIHLAPLSKSGPASEPWTGDHHLQTQNQTPSGHVHFSEQLFDGAVALPGVKEDGLGDFDDAVRQANDMW